jgi:hypothetical protein
MTSNDHQKQALLERDLYELSRPRESDETLRLALRAELAKRARPLAASKPRRRPAVRIAFAATALAALATAAVIALIGTGGSGSPDVASAAIIRHTLKAVTPPANTILHMKAVGVNGANVSGEWWQQTSPPHASRGIKGPLGHQGEFADNGTTSFTYDSATNTIYQRPDSAPPQYSDPLSQIRELLNSGQAQVLGIVEIDGLSLYKIELPEGVIGYVDKADYRPVYVDEPQRNGEVVRLHILEIGYLPSTPRNLSLLSMSAQHPDARVDTNPRDWPNGK